MKKVALFYYDKFAEFEIVLAGLLLHNKCEVVSMALEDKVYSSEEQQRFCADKLVKDVDVDSLDLLVIPGGDPFLLVENQELKAFVEALLQKNKKVAGICGGAMLLAGFGLLKGRKCTGDTSGLNPDDKFYKKYYAGTIVSDEQVVVDGNIITAQGQAYAEFAVELAWQMGLCKSQEDRDEALRWCKNIR
jgi:4-methyl-5(b-hydroxyethyl)-thiazole monophosphate biosynthesis